MRFSLSKATIKLQQQQLIRREEEEMISGAGKIREDRQKGAVTKIITKRNEQSRE